MNIRCKHASGLVRVLVGLLGTVGPAGLCWGQDVSQDLDRAFYFVDRLAQATSSFNAGRVEEALANYQELARDYAALDDDGAAAMGTADCLAMLNRNSDARAAYAAVLNGHPDLTARVTERLAELDVTDATDDSLARLRTAAESGKAADQWRLGRALQKRAQALLLEAAKTFRATGESTAGEVVPKASSLNAQAVALEELGRDLSSLIKHTETFWAVMRGQPCDTQELSAADDTGMVIERRKAEYVLRNTQGRRIEVQLRGEADNQGIQAIVDGKTIELNESDRRLIRRHQDWIKAVLVEASGRTNGK